MKSRGFGDTVAKAIKAVTFTSRLTKSPCLGCIKKQEYLNKKLPYKP